MLSQTIKSCTKNAVDILKKNPNIHNPNLEAEMLLSFILKKDRPYLFAHHDNVIAGNAIKKFWKLINKRLSNWPIAYLTNEKYFYGHKFFVNEKVLTPRPETETLVDCVIDDYKKNRRDRNIFVDIGTGSGCIVISLVKEISKLKNAKNINNFFASDISLSVLTIARKNSRLLGVNKVIAFKHSDLLNAYLRDKKFISSLCDSRIFISANLPYLTAKQIKSSPSIQKEPYTALYAPENGLYYYRKLLSEIKKIIEEKPADIFLYLEIDEVQNEKIVELLHRLIPNFAVKIVRDMSGYDRIAVAWFPGEKN